MVCFEFLKMIIIMIMTVVDLANRVVTLLYKVVASVDGCGVACWVVRVLMMMMMMMVMVIYI